MSAKGQNGVGPQLRDPPVGLSGQGPTTSRACGSRSEKSLGRHHQRNLHCTPEGALHSRFSYSFGDCPHAAGVVFGGAVARTRRPRDAVGGEPARGKFFKDTFLNFLASKIFYLFRRSLHENFGQFEMIRCPKGSWIRSRLRRDEFNCPSGVELISYISKILHEDGRWNCSLAPNAFEISCCVIS